jgi:taurine dioxygenase
MAECESDALLAQLYSQVHFPEYKAFFTYEEGSLAFWDNRACMHRATVDFSGSARAMRRVTVQGTDQPFWAPPRAATAAAAKL